MKLAASVFNVRFDEQPVRLEIAYSFVWLKSAPNTNLALQTNCDHYVPKYYPQSIVSLLWY